MDILFGNAQDADTQGTGWFVGFSDWTLNSPSGLLHVPKEQALAGLCIKWYEHPTGHESSGKPLSEGRSLSILVSEESSFQIDFCHTADFGADGVESVLLRRRGDFAAWGAGLFHRWRCLARSTVLTVRWLPV